MRKNLNKKSISILIGSMLLPLANNVLAQSINVKEDNVNIPISFNKEVSKFSINQLTGTKKLVIDFYDVKDSLTKEPLVNNSLISNINTKNFGDRLRVIIDVNSPVKYSLVKEGNNFSLKLEKSDHFEEIKLPLKAEVTAEVKPDNKFTPVKDIKIEPVKLEQTTKFTEVEHISMKKDGNANKITLDLNNTNFNPMFKKDGNTLILDLKGVNVSSRISKDSRYSFIRWSLKISRYRNTSRWCSFCFSGK